MKLYQQRRKRGKRPNTAERIAGRRETAVFKRE